jgi:predicted amidophosphoribosyltransferase
MNTVIFCKSCGNVFNLLYRYCPFCGNKKKETEQFPALLEKTFDKIDTVRTRNYISRLSILEQKLTVLEKELSAIITDKR